MTQHAHLKMHPDFLTLTVRNIPQAVRNKAGESMVRSPWF